MMHHRLGHEVVEASTVAALGGGAIDLKQGFGFGAADRLMLDRRGRQNTRAPRHIVGVQLAGEMHTALGGGSLAGNDAVADDCQRAGGGFTAGNFGRFQGSGNFGQSGQRGRHRSYSSQFLVLAP